MLISIITPTTGNPHLKQAVESIQNQDYDNIEHIIVIDGKERKKKARKILEKIKFKKNTHIMCLPYPTGKDGFNGHRIYGLSCYIANGSYMIFLDEDNWFDVSHVSSLVKLIIENKLDWAYSLRKIVDQDGAYIVNDECESLGKWPNYQNNKNHVDTNCYCIKKQIAIMLSPIWYRKFRQPGRIEVDTILCDTLVKKFPKCDTTGLYSVNYRVGSTDLSVKPEFFLYGKSVMEKIYPTGFPWRKVPNLKHL